MGKGGEFHSSGDLELDFVAPLLLKSTETPFLLLLVGPQIICFQVPHLAGLQIC